MSLELNPKLHLSWCKSLVHEAWLHQHRGEQGEGILLEIRVGEGMEHVGQAQEKCGTNLRLDPKPPPKEPSLTSDCLDLRQKST